MKKKILMVIIIMSVLFGILWGAGLLVQKSDREKGERANVILRDNINRFDTMTKQKTMPKRADVDIFISDTDRDIDKIETISPRIPIAKCTWQYLRSQKEALNKLEDILLWNERIQDIDVGLAGLQKGISDEKKESVMVMVKSQENDVRNMASRLKETKPSERFRDITNQRIDLLNVVANDIGEIYNNISVSPNAQAVNVGLFSRLTEDVNKLEMLKSPESINLWSDVAVNLPECLRVREK